MIQTNRGSVPPHEYGWRHSEVQNTQPRLLAAEDCADIKRFSATC
jgi:hypothetical protein